MSRRLDDAIGHVLEQGTRIRHQQRLRRVRWEAALEPGPGVWASRAAPPRDGNAVEVLVDGAAALPAIARAIAGARLRVHLAAWALTPSFALVRRAEHVTLRELLAEAAERIDVRVLLWSGAPLPVIHPSRRDARAALRELCAGTRIRGALDSTGRWTGACHEKIVLVDDREAFVGGIDPTSVDGDRFDEPGHPCRGASGWHDVSARLRGPAVRDVVEHFRMRWQCAVGEALPAPRTPPLAGGARVQIVRTIPEGAYPRVPDGEFTALAAHLAALRSARRLVHIETQYLRSVEIVDELAEKLRNPPDPRFRVVVVLPVRPRGGYDATRGQLRVLVDADGGAGRLVACSLRTEDGRPRRRVYVHAKLMVVDDAWLSVGSMNFSDHGLFNAVELQLITDDAGLARSTRARLWSEHLGLPEDAVRAADPVRIVDEHWRPVADEQLERERQRLPLTARVVRLPPASRRASRVIGPLQGLLLGT